MTNSVNAADEDGFDEEAERKAFQEAVQAWRRAPAPVTAATSESKQSHSITPSSTHSSTASSSSLWHNPFAAAASRPGVLDEALEHAVMNNSLMNR